MKKEKRMIYGQECYMIGESLCDRSRAEYIWVRPPSIDEQNNIVPLVIYRELENDIYIVEDEDKYIKADNKLAKSFYELAFGAVYFWEVMQLIKDINGMLITYRYFTRRRDTLKIVYDNTKNDIAKTEYEACENNAHSIAGEMIHAGKQVIIMLGPDEEEDNK